MVDLTIRGAGIIGLTIAWEAVNRGARVRVIDPAGPGAGASGGLVGALQPHTPDVWNTKKQFQMDSLLRARSLWPEIEAVSGLATGYARAGRLQPLADDRAVTLARARAAGALENWGSAATWRVIDAKEAGAWRPPSDSGLFVHDTLSALIHPRKAVESLAQALTMKGADIASDGPDAGPVIWATGWTGLRDLSDTLGRNVGAGVKGQAALLKHDAGGAPQVFASRLHIVPHLDGTVAIGSTSERSFEAPDTTDRLLEDIVARATELMPVLHGASVIDRWAGVRPRATSRAPLMGSWPGRKGHFVANGGFKIGFGVAPRMAEVMADLVLDGQDTIPDEFRLYADD